jgi:hypothetical protein
MVIVRTDWSRRGCGVLDHDKRGCGSPSDIFARTGCVAMCSRPELSLCRAAMLRLLQPLGSPRCASDLVANRAAQTLSRFYREDNCWSVERKGNRRCWCLCHTDSPGFDSGAH